MQWEGLGKFATRSCIAKKQIDSSAAACLSGEVHLQNTCNFVKPWHGDRGTAMQNNDYIRLYFANAGDQFILICRHIQMGSVKSFALERVWQTGEDNGNIAFFCKGDRFLKQRLICSFFVNMKSLCIRYGISGGI